MKKLSKTQLSQNNNKKASRPRIELGSKAPQASRISTTLPGHWGVHALMSFWHIKIIGCKRIRYCSLKEIWVLSIKVKCCKNDY